MIKTATKMMGIFLRLLIDTVSPIPKTGYR